MHARETAVKKGNAALSIQSFNDVDSLSGCILSTATTVNSNQPWL